MNNPTITYTPRRPNVMPETEIAALSNVYRFVIEATHKRKAARPDDLIVRNTEEVRHVDRRPD